MLSHAHRSTPALAVLLALAVAVTVVGLACGAVGLVAIGLVVATVAALGERSTELRIALPGGAMLVLRRALPELPSVTAGDISPCP
ncbi:MAG TPA: hypothetical protein VFF79_03025 [Conexibacter sp.]|jgi:hypothetical protein|nr:hypothetical protein [Conexibacter sp.]